MRHDRVFVFIVNLDAEELFDVFGRPHFDRVPSHAFTNVNADLATDTLIESDLHIRNHDVHAVRRITWRVFDTVDRTEADAGLTARAVVRNDDGDLLRLLSFTR